MRKLFISGIGTDVGKTMVAACLCEALQFDYWKPVQAGLESPTDSEKVRSLVTNSKTVVHPEAYRLNSPMSPHAAAEIDGVDIGLDKIKLPSIVNGLIIEGAGGLLVPLNRKQTIADLIAHLNAELILVSRNYLGSINHTLMSIDAARSHGLNILGLIYSGPENKKSEEAIESISGVKVLGRIPEFREMNASAISRAAAALRGI